MKEAIRTNGVSHFTSRPTWGRAALRRHWSGAEGLCGKLALKSHFYGDAEGLTPFHDARLFNYIYQRDEWGGS